VPRTISRSGAEGGLGDLRDAAVGVDAGIPQTPEMASLLRRIPPTRQHDGHHCVTVFDHLCVACHGFSVLLTGQVGDRRRSVLFDVGPYGDVWVDNAGRLGIDISLRPSPCWSASLSRPATSDSWAGVGRIRDG